MARGQKLTKTQKRVRRQRKQTHNLNNVVADTAACFTCSTEVVADFASQCAQARETLESDILFNDIAHHIWKNTEEERAQSIVAALAAFAAERQRHLTAINALQQRFDELARDGDFHHHLEPVEPYRAYIRDRIDSPARPAAD